MENKITGIQKKLLTFQMMDIAVKKDGKNPHFKSNYATLNEVLEKVKKPLNEMGVLIVQKPTTQDGDNGLETFIIDTEDGSFVECFMPYVDVSTAQKLGSCNTYLRRYSLVTLLGLEDMDDDGNKASEPTVQYAPKPSSKAIVAPKKTPFETAHDAIMASTTPEEMSKVAEKVTASTKLTEQEKADLMDTLQARSELV